MKLSTSLAATIALCALGATTTGAQAALQARPGGMVYDTVLNITWLADTNYAQTSGHTGTGVNADGRMTWDAATAWANNLVYGGFSDWRLPTLNPSDASCTGGPGPGAGAGLNCTGGELSHLFVTDLGNQGNSAVLNQVGDTPQQMANLALFSNVRSDFYWSGTEYAPFPSAAWAFLADVGRQDAGSKSSVLYAVAVRPGDVAAVPEPSIYAMALAGLGVLVMAVRRQRN